jgi:hypothetical protein
VKNRGKVNVIETIRQGKVFGSAMDFLVVHSNSKDFEREAMDLGDRGRGGNESHLDHGHFYLI